MKRWLLFLALLAASGTAWAAEPSGAAPSNTPVAAPGTPAAATSAVATPAVATPAAATPGNVQPDAAAPIAALNAGLLAGMKAAATENFAARAAALGPVIDRSFDLATILHNAIGLRWNTLPADQQTALLKAFRNFTIATYVSNFASNDGTHFAMLPEQRDVGADVIVESQILPASGEPVRIDYLMRKGAIGWQAVDVLLEGTISRVAVTRSDFRSLLDSNDASRLIADLRKKTKTLSGGAVDE